METVYGMTESDLDNLLVDQKNSILRLVNAGEFDRAETALDVVSALWHATRYGYKFREITERIATERNA